MCIQQVMPYVPRKRAYSEARRLAARPPKRKEKGEGLSPLAHFLIAEWSGLCQPTDEAYRPRLLGLAPLRRLPQLLSQSS